MQHGRNLVSRVAIAKLHEESLVVNIEMGKNYYK